MAPERLSISNLELTLYKTPMDSTSRYLDGAVVTPAAADIIGALQVSLLLCHCLASASSSKSKTSQMVLFQQEISPGP